MNSYKVSGVSVGKQSPMLPTGNQIERRPTAFERRMGGTASAAAIKQGLRVKGSSRAKYISNNNLNGTYGRISQTTGGSVPPSGPQSDSINEDIMLLTSDGASVTNEPFRHLTGHLNKPFHNNKALSMRNKQTSILVNAPLPPSGINKETTRKQTTKLMYQGKHAAANRDHIHTGGKSEMGFRTEKSSRPSMKETIGIISNSASAASGGSISNNTYNNPILANNESLDEILTSTNQCPNGDSDSITPGQGQSLHLMQIHLLNKNNSKRAIRSMIKKEICSSPTNKFNTINSNGKLYGSEKKRKIGMGLTVIGLEVGKDRNPSMGGIQENMPKGPLHNFINVNNIENSSDSGTIDNIHCNRQEVHSSLSCQGSPHKQNTNSGNIRNNQGNKGMDQKKYKGGKKRNCSAVRHNEGRGMNLHPLEPLTTQMHRWKTKRLHFHRRHNVRTHPLLIINFEGVIGDIFWPNLWKKEGSPFYFRPDWAVALNDLLKYFQVALVCGYRGKNIQSLLDILKRRGVVFDAVYKNLDSNKVTSDYTQILQDFQFFRKEALSKVLVLASLNMSHYEMKLRNTEDLLIETEEGTPIENSTIFSTNLPRISQIGEGLDLNSVYAYQRMPLTLFVPDPKMQKAFSCVSLNTIAKTIFYLGALGIYDDSKLSEVHLTESTININDGILNITSKINIGFNLKEEASNEKGLKKSGRSNSGNLPSILKKVNMGSGPFMGIKGLKQRIQEVRLTDSLNAVYVELAHATMANINFYKCFGSLTSKNSSNGSLRAFETTLPSDVLTLQLERDHKLRLHQDDVLWKRRNQFLHSHSIELDMNEKQNQIISSIKPQKNPNFEICSLLLANVYRLEFTHKTGKHYSKAAKAELRKVMVKNKFGQKKERSISPTGQEEKGRMDSCSYSPKQSTSKVLDTSPVQKEKKLPPKRRKTPEYRSFSHPCLVLFPFGFQLLHYEHLRFDDYTADSTLNVCKWFCKRPITARKIISIGEGKSRPSNDFLATKSMNSENIAL